MDKKTKGWLIALAIIIAVIIVIAIIVSSSGPLFSPATSIRDNCRDTDGGWNVWLRGTVSGNSNGRPYSYTDFCFEGARLMEYYCIQGRIFGNDTFNCGTGACSNGACVNQSLLPDLDVISFTYTNQSFNQTHSRVTLWALIKNIGNANAGSSTTRFIVSYEVTHYDPLGNLAPGQQMFSNTTYILPRESNYSANVLADWNNVVQESNENNNGASLTIFT